jgi:hypothetical protein
VRTVRTRLAISASILAVALTAGCGGSQKHEPTIDSIRSCLSDAGFAIRGEGHPGTGDALAFRSPGKQSFAYGVAALFDDEHAAATYRDRFVGVLDRPPRNPDADYLKTLVRTRGKLVYGWTTKPATADIRTLERCTQAR